MENEDAELDSALKQLAHEASIVVDGTRIAYRVWGSPDAKATIVLVHGGCAHSHWWDPIAPSLTVHGRVIALDLSGHGDSEWRDAYGIPVWANDILAVMKHAAVGPIVIVGHSLGGVSSTFLARSTALSSFEGITVAGVIAVDSLIQGIPEAEADALLSVRRRVYPTLEDGLARFRPVPKQAAIQRVVDHVAKHSLRRTEAGWEWKFDVAAIRQASEFVMPDGVATSYAYLRAGRGLPVPGARELVRGVGGSYRVLADAGHAPMLDYPRAFARVLGEIAAGWLTRGC